MCVCKCIYIIYIYIYIYIYQDVNLNRIIHYSTEWMMIGLDNPNVLQEDALNLEYLLKLQHQDHLISFQMNLFKVNKISLWP